MEVCPQVAGRVAAATQDREDARVPGGQMAYAHRSRNSDAHHVEVVACKKRKQVAIPRIEQEHEVAIRHWWHIVALR